MGNLETGKEPIRIISVNSILAFRFSKKIPQPLKEAFIEHLVPLEKIRNDPKDYRLASLSDKGTGRVHDIVDPSFNCLKKSWISTEFLLKDNKASINGEINNISKEQFPNLYEDIQNIFNSMIPYMNEVRDLSIYEKLNVIVKIQSYQLKENEAYDGQFHQEGFKKEGIFMVGIYYFHVSPNLKGGDLELKYVKRKEIDENKILNLITENKLLPIEEDDIAIFLNRRCQHRINKLQVISPKVNKIYDRKILSFFIADPEKSVIPTSNGMTQLNQIKPMNEIEIAYAERDAFKNNRLFSKINEGDYSENELTDQQFIEITEFDYQSKLEQRRNSLSNRNRNRMHYLD